MKQPKTKLFIAVPVYQDISVQFLFCLLNIWQGRLTVPYEIKFMHGESLVTRVRNRLTADFLASDCTHLLFIDSDILFSVDDLNRIASHDKHIVGGIYTLKRADTVIWCANTFEGQEVKPDKDGMVNVNYLATGFLRISRRVFQKMIEADGDKIGYGSDLSTTRGRIEYDFWRVGVFGDRYLSEDWYFCQRANDLGFKVWADTNVLLRHFGTAAYPLVQMDAPPVTNQGTTLSSPQPAAA